MSALPGGPIQLVILKARSTNTSRCRIRSLTSSADSRLPAGDWFEKLSLTQVGRESQQFQIVPVAGQGRPTYIQLTVRNANIVALLS